MFKNVEKKILKAKVNNNPFPHIIINNLIPTNDLLSLIKFSPSFSESDNKNVLFQSSSQTKKTIMPNSRTYRNLLKKNSFKKLNDTFRNIEPLIRKKFNPNILKYVNKKFHNSKLKYHMSLSLMRKGYLKSAHTDRRDHLIHSLFYIVSESTKGGDIQLIRLKKKQKVYDVFPSKNSVKVTKSYKIKKNFCIFTLNVPWAYHAVTKYNGKSDRKYFYAVYDFKIKNSGEKLKNRKKGFNMNIFWKNKVKTKSSKRKKIFLSE